MVELKRFSPADDFDGVVAMHYAQKSDYSNKLRLDTLPTIGWVAKENKIPVAAGFLRRVEGGFGQIDTLVTNPDMPPELRNDSIDMVVRNLISDAKSLNFKGIICYSRDSNTLARSKSFGFQLLTQELPILG